MDMEPYLWSVDEFSLRPFSFLFLDLFCFSDKMSSIPFVALKRFVTQ